VGIQTRVSTAAGEPRQANPLFVAASKSGEFLDFAKMESVDVLPWRDGLSEVLAFLR
jgi:hypothetical protein